MPDVVTHRYDPAIGICPNICSLPDFEALVVLDQLRRKFRPSLKPNYLARRRATEQWLSEAASKLLERRFDQGPGYFFLGDFSHIADPSRPAALIVPLSTLPSEAITFTLGDSMSVIEQPGRRVYSLDEVVALFAASDAVAGFGLSDRRGFQDRFIEVQVWRRSDQSHDYKGVVSSKSAKSRRRRRRCMPAAVLAIALSFASIAAAAEPERRAVAYLAQETPRWYAENHCFSCHNNGDGARALFLSAQRGYVVPANALEDTVRWLRDPAGWDHNPGNPGFSDKRLARIQFAAALAEAWRTGYMRERDAATLDALSRAAESLVREQESAGEFLGAWRIDTGGVAGAPATYGSALATYMARRTLEIADARRFTESIGRANQWLNSTPPHNILDRAAILLALPDSAPKHLDALLAAQTSDGGWGPQPHAPAEAFDTAVALLALHGLRGAPNASVSIDRGRAFLVKYQLADGSWPETTRPAGFTSYAERISTAAWAAYALLITDPKGN
jgi:hypothetical protein